MSSVDERVVEMRFDNAQFEHGVQQTISSLDRLKQGLKFDNVLNGANTLQNAFNNIKLKKINDNVASLNKRFSAAGVAGMEVVKRVTNSALNAAKQITSVIPNQIKNGGWSRAMNLANAKFQLEGLGESWKNVGKDVSFAVNQTSYGLDEAARVAGQLAASGVKASEKIKLTNDNVDDFAAKMDGVTDRMHAAQNALKSNDLDQMSIALRGISGVASMTGASFSEIGQIFTRVAGQGRVYATDLNSIAVRGLNATAILAQQLGKSEADIRDMTKKGEIDFNTFSNAMYNAFANQATKANDTFTGSLANMKSALSRIGADVADDVLPAGTKVFNSLRLMFNQVHKTVQPVLDSLGKLVVASGNTISGVIDQITGKMGKGGKAFTAPIQVISKAIDGLTAGVEALGEKAGVKRTISDVKALADAMKSVNEKYNTLKNISQGFQNIGKIIGNALDAVKESFLWTFKDWGTDLSKINIKSLSKQFADFTGTFANSTFRMERLRQIIGNIVNGILEFAKPIATTIKTLGQAIDETFNDIWGNGSGFASLTKTFRDFSRSMDLTKDGAEGLKDVFKAILSPLRVIVPLASTATKVILNFLAAINRVAGKGLDALGKSGALKKAGDAITQFGQKIKDAFDKLKEWGSKNDVFNKFAAACATAFVKVVEVVAKFVETLGKAGSAVAEWGSKHQVFQKFGAVVAEGFTKARDAVTKFFGAIKDSGALSGIGNFFKTIGSTVVDFFSKLSKTEGFSKLVDGIGKLKDAIGTRLEDVFGKIADGLGKLGGVKVDASGLDKIVGFFDKLSGFVGTGLGKFGDFLKEENPIKRLIDWIKELGQDIADSKFADVITKIPEFFKNLFNAIKDGLQNFTFKGAFDSIKDFFKNGFSVDVYGAELNDDSDVEKIKGATQRKSSGIISAVKGMASNIKNAVGSIDWASIGKSIQNGVGKVIDGINSVFANPAVKLLADNIRSFLTAILAIRALKKVGDMFDSFAGIGDSIAGFFKTLSGKIAGNLPKKSKLKDFTECVAILAGTLAGLSILNHYIGIDPGAIGALAGIIGSLVAVFEIIGKVKVDTKQISAFNGMCRSLAFAVGTLAAVMAALTKMDPDQYDDGIVKLGVLLALIGGTIVAINDLSTKPIKAGGTLVGLALALTALLIPLNIIKSMPWDKYKDGAIKLGILMGELAVLVGVMNRISGGNSVKFGALAGMAVAMLAAVKALSDMMNAFDQLDPKGKNRTKIYADLLVAAAAIAGIFVAFGGALALAGTNKKSTGTALAMIFDILSVMMALNTLSENVKTDGMKPLITAAATMAGVFIAWGGALALAGTNKKSTGTALAMIGDILAVFVALQTLSETASTGNGFKALIASAASMAGVFLALGGAIKMISGAKINTGALLGMIVAISGVGLALNGLAQYDWTAIAAAGAAMTGALLALGGAMKMMSGTKINVSTIVAMAVGIGMLAPALAALSNVKFTNLVGGAAGLFAGFAAVAGGLKLISAAAPAATGALAALAQLAGGITLLGGSIMAAASMITAGASMITNAIGAIVGIFSKGNGNKVKAAADEMNKGIVDSLKSLGKGYKSFGKGIGDGVGGAIESIIQAFTNGTPKVKGASDNLTSTLMDGQNGEKVQTAIAGNYDAIGNEIDTGTGVITKKTDDGGEKVKASTDQFQTTLLNGFDPSKFFKGKGKLDLSSMIKDYLPDDALSGFSDKAKAQLDKVFGNLDINNLQDSIQNSITKGGGIDVDKMLSGIKGFDSLGSDVKEKVVSQLKDAFAGGDIDPSQLLDVTKMFGDISGKAEEGGKQVGQSAMTGAQQGIQEGQEGLKTGMSQNLSSLIEQQQAATEQIENTGIQGGQAYASGLQEGMQNVSGAVTTIGSSVVSGLMEYGSQLEGEGRNSGMQYVNGLQEGMSNINGVVNLAGSGVVTALLNYGSQISNQGRITGTQFVDAFKQGLSGLNGAVTFAGSGIVTSLLNYASQLSSQGQNMGMQFAQGLQSGMSQAAASVASTVSHIVSIVSGMGGSFTAAGSACGMLFRAGLNSGMSGISGTVAAAVSQAASALTSLGGRFTTAGRTAGTQYVSGLRAGAGQARSAGQQLVTNAASGLQAGAAKFRTAGTQGANQYVSGLRAGAGQARSAGQQLAQQSVSGMNSSASQGRSAGQKTGQSYVSGLSTSSGAARAAGTAVANAGTSGMNAGASSAYSYGAHLGQNFAKGIMSSVGAVRAAAAQLAAAAKANIGHSAPKEGPLKGGEVPYGLHAGQNFAEGLKKATPNVSTASMKMAQTVQNAMTDSIVKSLSTTKQGTNDLINLLNSGTDRVVKSTVDITKMVNDQWAKTHKATNKSKSSSSDSSDTDPNESFVSGLSSDIEKAKERNQLSLADEIKGYKLAMEKVKASANATKDAQKNANDAIYDAAEKYVEKRQKQFGDYSTDESIFWKAITETVDKGSEAYTKSVDKMNDAVISDTEHLLTVRKRQVGEYETQATTIWEISKQGAKKLGASEKAIGDINDKQADALISDGEHMIALRKKYLGEYEGNAAEVWKHQMEYGKKLGVNQEAQERAMFNYSDGLISDTEDAINKQKSIMGDAVTNTADYWDKCVEDLKKAAAQGKATQAALNTAIANHSQALITDTKQEIENHQKVVGDAMVRTTDYWDRTIKKMQEEVKKGKVLLKDLQQAETEAAEAAYAEEKAKQSREKTEKGDDREIDPTRNFAQFINLGGKSKEAWDALDQANTDVLDLLKQKIDKAKKQNGEFWNGQADLIRDFEKEWNYDTDKRIYDSTKSATKQLEESGFISDQEAIIKKLEEQFGDGLIVGSKVWKEAEEVAKQRGYSQETIEKIVNNRQERQLTDIKNEKTLLDESTDIGKMTNEQLAKFYADRESTLDKGTKEFTEIEKARKEASKDAIEDIYDDAKDLSDATSKFYDAYPTNQGMAMAKALEDYKAKGGTNPKTLKEFQSSIDSGFLSDIDNALTKAENNLGSSLMVGADIIDDIIAQAKKYGASEATITKMQEKANERRTTDISNQKDYISNLKNTGKMTGRELYNFYTQALTTMKSGTKEYLEVQKLQRDAEKQMQEDILSDAKDFNTKYSETQNKNPINNAEISYKALQDYLKAGGNDPDKIYAQRKQIDADLLSDADNKLTKAQNEFGDTLINGASIYEDEIEIAKKYGASDATIAELQAKANERRTTDISNQKDYISNLKNTGKMTGRELYNFYTQALTTMKSGTKEYLEVQKLQRDAEKQMQEDILSDAKDFNTKYSETIDATPTGNAEISYKALQDYLKAGGNDPDKIYNQQKQIDDDIISDAENTVKDMIEIYGEAWPGVYQAWDTAAKNADIYGGSDVVKKRIQDEKQSSLKNYYTWTENLLDEQETFKDKYFDGATDMFVEARKLAIKNGLKDKAELKNYDKKIDEVIVKDAQNRVEKLKHIYGDDAPAYSVWIKQIAKAQTDEVKASNAAIAELQEEAGKAFKTNIDSLLGYYTTWNDITTKNYNQNEKVLTMKLWGAVAAATKQGTEENLQAQQAYFKASQDLISEYYDNVKSKADSLISGFNMTSDTDYSEAPDASDIILRFKNYDAALSMQQEYLDKLRTTGIFSDDLMEQFENISTTDFRILGVIANMSENDQRAIQEYWNGIVNHSIGIAKQSNQKLLDGLDPAFKMMSEKVKSTVEDLTSDVGGVLTDDKTVTKFVNAINQLADTSLKDIRVTSKVAEFEVLGNNISEGLAKGISDGTIIVSDSIADVVNKALASAKTAADSHSPSKKTIKLGQYMGEGLVIGLKNWMSQAGVAGDQLTNGALGGLSSRIADIVDAMGQDMDMSPVITPVLDLSQIENGFATYNNMVTAAKAQEISARMRASYVSNADAQNGVSNQPISNTSIGRINITINPTPNQDANDIANSVLNRLNNEIVRKGKVFSA